MGAMATAATTSARPYRGIEAADRTATRRARLLGAGLDLLGADDAAELTVRGICRQAGVAAAPPEEQTRAGMANIVRTIGGDPRVGRLLFSAQLANTVLVRKRVESSALVSLLSGRHVENAL